MGAAVLEFLSKAEVDKILTVAGIIFLALAAIGEFKRDKDTRATTISRGWRIALAVAGGIFIALPTVSKYVSAPPEVRFCDSSKPKSQCITIGRRDAVEKIEWNRTAWEHTDSDKHNGKAYTTVRFLVPFDKPPTVVCAPDADKENSSYCNVAVVTPDSFKVVVLRQGPDPYGSPNTTVNWLAFGFPPANPADN